MRAIPLFLNPVAAGFPTPAEDHVDCSLNLHELLIAHPAATFFVRVEGKSMEGAGIFSGDLLIVDRAIAPVQGKIVVAVINGEFTVKRILKKGKKLFLAAENPSFAPLEISPESDFQVWGVVTYVIHPT